jgi:glycerol-3-phosphate dehydrogenase
MKREQGLDQVKKREKPWDIIVVGGGATGLGIAVDAASRGFKTLLLEQRDLPKEHLAGAQNSSTEESDICNKETFR